MSTMIIPPNSVILNHTELNINQIEKDKNENFIINSITDKLNVMGAYFCSINNNKMDNKESRLNKIINKETNIFKQKTEIEKINNITICTFNDESTADNPNPDEEYANYFINTYMVNKKLKKLNNKRFFGFDKIPNTV